MGGNRVSPPPLSKRLGGEFDLFPPPSRKRLGGELGSSPPKPWGEKIFGAPKAWGEKIFLGIPHQQDGGDNILAPNWPKNDVNCREKPDLGPILENFGGDKLFHGGGRKSSPPHAMGGGKRVSPPGFRRRGGECLAPTRIQTSWGGNFFGVPPTMGGECPPLPYAYVDTKRN